MTSDPVVLFLGGSESERTARRAREDLERLGSDATVIAADSGLHRAWAAGVSVDHLVGDLDSADPALVDRLGGSTVLHRHSTDKDATDTELALELARALREPAGDTPLVVIGEAGGRLDHLLADIALLASPLTHGFRVRAHLGPTNVAIVRGGQTTTVTGRVHEIVSLLAHGGPARGVTTRGLRWPLIDATLRDGTTRGVSNELVASTASVTVGDGTLVVLQPDATGSVGRDRIGPYDPSPR